MAVPDFVTQTPSSSSSSAQPDGLLLPGLDSDMLSQHILPFVDLKTRFKLSSLNQTWFRATYDSALPITDKNTNDTSNNLNSRTKRKQRQVEAAASLQLRQQILLRFALSRSLSDRLSFSFLAFKAAENDAVLALNVFLRSLSWEAVACSCGLRAVCEDSDVADAVFERVDDIRIKLAEAEEKRLETLNAKSTKENTPSQRNAPEARALPEGVTLPSQQKLKDALDDISKNQKLQLANAATGSAVRASCRARASLQNRQQQQQQRQPAENKKPEPPRWAQLARRFQMPDELQQASTALSTSSSLRKSSLLRTRAKSHSPGKKKPEQDSTRPRVLSDASTAAETLCGEGEPVRLANEIAAAPQQKPSLVKLSNTLHNNHPVVHSTFALLNAICAIETDDEFKLPVRSANSIMYFGDDDDELVQTVPGTHGAATLEDFDPVEEIERHNACNPFFQDDFDPDEMERRRCAINERLHYLHRPALNEEKMLSRSTVKWPSIDKQFLPFSELRCYGAEQRQRLCLRVPFVSLGSGEGQPANDVNITDTGAEVQTDTSGEAIDTNSDLLQFAHLTRHPRYLTFVKRVYKMRRLFVVECARQCVLGNASETVSFLLTTYKRDFHVYDVRALMKAARAVSISAQRRTAQATGQTNDRSIVNAPQTDAVAEVTLPRVATTTTNEAETSETTPSPSDAIQDSISTFFHEISAAQTRAAIREGLLNAEQSGEGATEESRSASSDEEAG